MVVQGCGYGNDKGHSGGVAADVCARYGGTPGGGAPAVRGVEGKTRGGEDAQRVDGSV